MLSYPHIPIGLSTGLPERLSKLKTREHLRAAFARQDFGPRHSVSAEFRPEPEIMQWLIAPLPWGHITPVLGWVKGQRCGFGRTLVGTANRGANS